MESGLEDITNSELIDLFIELRLIDLHKVTIGRVESYDTSAGTVQVTPMINKMIPDGATPPNYVSEQMPALADVPVAQTRGGGFFAAFPLKKGDFGILLYCDRNIAAWRGTGNQSDPGDLGLHTLSSGLFIPAMAPDASAIKNADANNLVIGSDTEPKARIVIKPTGEIDLGAAAASFIARADKAIAHFNAINNLLANCTPAGTETGLAAVKLAAQGLQTAGFADVATDNAKVD